jgi:hypothetical protein
MKSFTYRVSTGDTNKGNVGFCFDVQIDRRAGESKPKKSEIIEQALALLESFQGDDIEPLFDLEGMGEHARFYLDGNDEDNITIVDGDEFIDDVPVRQLGPKPPAEETPKRPKQFSIKLPQWCYVFVETTQQISRVFIGIQGHWPCMLRDPSWAEVDKLNKQIGVTPKQARIMHEGSVFDWAPIFRSLAVDLEGGKEPRHWEKV